MLIMITNPDPISKLALKLLLEGLLDLNHVTLTARNDNTHESLIISAKTFHRFLHL